MPERPASIPVYRERSALQALVGKDWLPASNLYPAGPSTIVNMLSKGWLQRRQDKMFGWTYHITATGEAALRAKIPSKPRKRGLQRQRKKKEKDCNALPAFGRDEFNTSGLNDAHSRQFIRHPLNLRHIVMGY